MRWLQISLALLLAFSTISLVSSLNNETIVPCVGNSELIVGCFGNNETIFVSENQKRDTVDTTLETFGVPSFPERYKWVIEILIGLIFLVVIILAMIIEGSVAKKERKLQRQGESVAD